MNGSETQSLEMLQMDFCKVHGHKFLTELVEFSIIRSCGDLSVHVFVRCPRCGWLEKQSFPFRPTDDQKQLLAVRGFNIDKLFRVPIKEIDV